MANKYASIVEAQDGRYSGDILHTPKLDEGQISKIEAQLGYGLPKDYREFLRDYEGIEFKNTCFSLVRDGDQDEVSIGGFYSNITKCYYTTQEYLKDWLETDWYPGIDLIRDPLSSESMSWPEELLPIGYDMGGNQICLALFGRRPHAIFWWRDNPWMKHQNLYLIANSFDEFMHLLYMGE